MLQIVVMIFKGEHNLEWPLSWRMRDQLMKLGKFETNIQIRACSLILPVPCVVLQLLMWPPKVTCSQSIFNLMEQLNWCFIFACLLVFSCVGSGLLASFVQECQLLKPRFATMHACKEFQINNLSNASWIIYYMINHMIKFLFTQRPDKPKCMQPTSTQAQHTHTHTATTALRSADMFRYTCVCWIASLFDPFLMRFFPVCNFGKAWNPARRFPMLPLKAKEQHHPAPDLGPMIITAWYNDTVFGCWCM